jgi:hypothetical protein
MKLKQWVNPKTGKRYTWADSEELQAQEAQSVELTEEEKQLIREKDEALKKQLDEGLISEAEYKTLASTETQHEEVVDMGFNFPGAEVMPMNGGFIEDKFLPESELPDFGAELTAEDKINLALKWGRLYTPSEWIELEKKYNEMINSFDGVYGAYDLIINNYGPNKIIASVHIEVDDSMTAKEIQSLSNKISMKAYQEFNIILTVGIYATNSSDDESVKIKNDIADILKEYPMVLQLHGYYVNEDEKSVSFDLVIDFEEKEPGKVAEEIKSKISSLHPAYQFSIIVDADVSD